MKVVHICTSDSGGAGLCCCRIHKSLLNLGIDSHVIVMEKKRNDYNVVEYGRKRYKLWKGINKLLRLLGLQITLFNKLFELCANTKQCFTSPYSVIDVSKHPLVKAADVIHLHWINRMIDYPSFFKKVKKPIIWTLHDENLFLGAAHYAKDCDLAGDLEIEYSKTKKKIFSEISQMGIVFLSKMMYDQYHTHKILNGRKTTIINNAVDYTAYKPIPKNTARIKYGIDDNALVFVFVAASIDDPRKGLNILVSTLEKMNISNAIILAVGNNIRGFEHSIVKSIGAITDSDKMSMAYSCADYFIMPSLQEAFAQTPLEAMACGIPAIVFPVSGTEELITSTNGIRCKGFALEDLEEGIKKAMSVQYDSVEIRKDVIGRFAPEKIAKEYIKFYKLICEV